MAHPCGWCGNGREAGIGAGGGVTGAIGIGAIRAGLAGAAAVGLEETRVAGWAAGLHARGGQLHCPLQILTADFRLGPFVHELCLQKQSMTQPACVGLAHLQEFTLRVGGFWAPMKAPPRWGTLFWSPIYPRPVA